MAHDTLDRHLERGRAAYDSVIAAGGDVMAAALAWINTSFDDQARADMLREREIARLEAGIYEQHDFIR